MWFKKWLQAAKEATEKPNVCAFATVTDEHLPSVRMMSLKEVDEFDGFEFFFNFESETGKSVCFKQKASLVFYWAQLDRQVRIDGDVEILGDDGNAVSVFLKTKSNLTFFFFFFFFFARNNNRVHFD